MRQKEEEPLTNTEMLACFVGNRISLMQIRCMAYEKAKIYFIMRAYTAREASRMAGERVIEFENEMDSIFL
jgi:hypothetical protein